MHISRVLASISLIVPLVVAACGSDDAEPVDTLQACYDEHHHGEESLPVQDAIAMRRLDHPIAGVHPSCADTQADCVAHVAAELDPSVVLADIGAACTT